MQGWTAELLLLPVLVPEAEVQEQVVVAVEPQRRPAKRFCARAPIFSSGHVALAPVLLGAMQPLQEREQELPWEALPVSQEA